MEMLEQLAPEVAVELCHDEDAILGKLVRLIKWGLGRCPDNLPPSSSAVVIGPHAAKHIARAALWLGDPDEFVNAICNSQFSILQKMPGGVRIRGLDRYDAAWKKNHKPEWAALQLLNGGCSAAKPELNRSESAAKPEPQTHTHTQTHNLLSSKVDSRPAEPPKNIPILYEEPQKPEESWNGDDFFSWSQVQRQENGLMPDKQPHPRKLSGWWSAAFLAVKGDVARLKKAYFKFGADQFWEAKDPPHPFPAFMSQCLEKYVPQEAA